MEEKIEIIEITDPRYPVNLRNLDKYAPARLYCIGDTGLLYRRAAAVVGARKASSYGKWASKSIGQKLAEYDVVTVSGMAYGCDAAAHEGALNAGGGTIAVLGCGIDICYPRQNKELMKKIIKKGLVISEFKPGTKPYAGNFPRRNRIISGLAELVIVAEASLSSGSLITAGFAAEQGKTVMAVPGNISNIMSIGANRLIQDGAAPVVCMEDVLVELGINMKNKHKSKNPELGSDEKSVFDFIKNNGEVTADLIADMLNKPVSEVNALISILEIKGLVLTYMGKICIAK